MITNRQSFLLKEVIRLTYLRDNLSKDLTDTNVLMKEYQDELKEIENQMP